MGYIQINVADQFKDKVDEVVGVEVHQWLGRDFFDNSIRAIVKIDHPISTENVEDAPFCEMFLKQSLINGRVEVVDVKRRDHG